MKKYLRLYGLLSTLGMQFVLSFLLFDYLVGLLEKNIQFFKNHQLYGQLLVLTLAAGFIGVSFIPIFKEVKRLRNYENS